MSFAENSYRANDNPNAFKLAMRLANAFAEVKPKEMLDHTFRFQITAPDEQSPAFEVAKELLQAALNDRSLGRGSASITQDLDHITVYSPHIPKFPLHEVMHHLNRMQARLSNH